MGRTFRKNKRDGKSYKESNGRKWGFGRDKDVESELNRANRYNRQSGRADFKNSFFKGE